MSFRREILWHPGYDHVAENPNRGRHGMEIRWLLHGDRGTIQFVIYSGWLPSWVTHNEFGPTVDPDQRLPMRDGMYRRSIHAPMAADLGFHWRTAPPWLDSDAPSRDSCEHLDDRAPCWYDGSGLNAEPVFAKLLTDGEEAVWQHMANYYDTISEEAPT